MDTGSGPDWGQQEASEARRWSEDHEHPERRKPWKQACPCQKWADDYDTHDTDPTTKGQRIMGRYASATGNGDFEDAPLGTHVARCVRIYDIGTHTGEYNGKVNTRNQIVFAFELPEERMEDGQPFIIHKFATNSLHEKATLRADLEAWRGRQFTAEELAKFDLQAVLGKCCLLSVIEKNGKHRAGGVMALPKGTKVPDAHNNVWAYWIDEHDETKFAQVPKGFQKLIMESQEMRGDNKSNGNGASTRATADDDDDIPF